MPIDYLETGRRWLAPIPAKVSRSSSVRNLTQKNPKLFAAAANLSFIARQLETL